MIARETYFNLLASYIDKPFIKIITGLRRSGKSVLLNNDGLNLAVKDLKDNFEMYIERYLRWQKK